MRQQAPQVICTYDRDGPDGKTLLREVFAAYLQQQLAEDREIPGDRGRDDRSD